MAGRNSPTSKTFPLLNPLAYLLSRRFSQLHHVLMTFDFPRFTNSERTNEMTLNKAVGLREILEFCDDIGKAASVRIVLRENEDQLLPRRKACFPGIGNEVGHKVREGTIDE